MGIREIRMPTDHRMVLGKLMGEGSRSHHRCCKGRDIWPIAASKGKTVHEGDSHFSDLKKMVKKPFWKARKVALWISDATKRLSDQRTEMGQTHMSDQR